jgi:hypothetical protein
MLEKIGNRVCERGDPVQLTETRMGFRNLSGCKGESRGVGGLLQFDHWSGGCFVLHSISQDPFPGIIQAGEVLGLHLSAGKPSTKANTPEFPAAVRNFNHANSRGQVGDLGSLHA